MSEIGLFQIFLPEGEPCSREILIFRSLSWWNHLFYGGVCRLDLKTVFFLSKIVTILVIRIKKKRLDALNTTQKTLALNKERFLKNLNKLPFLLKVQKWYFFWSFFLIFSETVLCSAVIHVLEITESSKFQKLQKIYRNIGFKTEPI